ncbi:hypothetical protein [Cellulophaga sp. RHA19]|uniref:hypothetical protein n=1 Tax=Cellulophaga sp. RHA19 TaxID=1798237 RepID=UPI0012FD34DE|nr:hypothetical protein [Cellulophaga sp. RHA19]
MKIFSKNKYYIRLYTNRIEIRDLVNKKSISDKSQMDFNNLRLLIADFDTAEKFISSVFKKNALSTKNSVGIIQQMEMSEGGLSQVEKRILQELFSGIGIREIYVDESLTYLTEKQLIAYKK